MSKVFAKKFLIPLLILVALLLVAILISINRFSSREPLSRAPDYSWVIGRLEYNSIEGGFWQIRFGKENDPYNGKFVLGNQPQLSRFRHGDLVKITGKISQDQVSIYQSGTLYNLESIDLYQ